MGRAAAAHRAPHRQRGRAAEAHPRGRGGHGRGLEPAVCGCAADRVGSGRHRRHRRRFFPGTLLRLPLRPGFHAGQLRGHPLRFHHAEHPRQPRRAGRRRAGRAGRGGGGFSSNFNEKRKAYGQVQEMVGSSGWRPCGGTARSRIRTGHQGLCGYPFEPPQEKPRHRGDRGHHGRRG